jgi:3-hydroxypropionyl-coenzyme A dehydratase
LLDSVDVITELSSAIDTVSADDSIKVVIITGKGERSFCAGADIRYVVNINPIEAEKYASSVHTITGNRNDGFLETIKVE